MPEKPTFPLIMLMAAAMKDFLFDPLVAFLTLLVLPLGWLFGIFLSLIYVGIFWLWVFFRPSSTRGTRLIGRAMARAFIAAGVTVIPFAGPLVPEMTIVVWLTYRAEVEEWEKERGAATRALQGAVNDARPRRASGAKAASGNARPYEMYGGEVMQEAA